MFMVSGQADDGERRLRDFLRLEPRLGVLGDLAANDSNIPT